MRRLCFSFGCLLLMVAILLPGARQTPLYAQDNCNSLITQDLSPAMGRCATLNTGWACYGNRSISALPILPRFNRPSDRELLSNLQVIDTLDKTGVALIRLHVLPDQDPVSVVLYGDVKVTPTGQNVFIMQLDDTGYICQATPPGMVARTESGDRARITVNGVDIDLESTAFITQLPNGLMIVANIEGKVTVTAGGVAQPLQVGEQIAIEQTASGPVFAGPPAPSPFFASGAVQWLAHDDNGLRRVSDPNREPDPVIRACGGEITFGETITAENADPGQECLYTFCAEAGELASINLDAVAGPLDPWIDLRGPDGALLYVNNDINQDSANSLICNRGLPTTGCYTIVARPWHNESSGTFELSLNRQSDCTSPTPRCEVATRRGLNLRSGPGLNFPRLRALPQDTRLEVEESSADNSWVRVQVVDAPQAGWVNTSAQFLTCEEPLGPPTPTWTPGPTATLTPTPTSTPTPTPREKEKKKTPTPTPCPKCAPFSAP